MRLKGSLELLRFQLLQLSNWYILHAKSKTAGATRFVQEATRRRL